MIVVVVAMSFSNSPNLQAMHHDHEQLIASVVYLLVTPHDLAVSEEDYSCRYWHD